MGVLWSLPTGATASVLMLSRYSKLTMAISRSHTPQISVFRFCDLPAEIRNQIYDHVFTEPDGYCMTVARKKCFCGQYGDQLIGKSDRIDLCSHRSTRKTSPLSLLLTSRSIYQECSQLPYTLNTFKMHQSQYGYTPEYVAKTFIARIGERNAAAVKSIVLCMGNNSLNLFTMSLRTYLRRTLTFARNNPGLNVHFEALVLYWQEQRTPPRHHRRRWLEVTIDTTNVRHSMELLHKRVRHIRDKSGNPNDQYPLNSFLIRLDSTMQWYCYGPGLA